jgi:hypothetical protein
MCTRRLRRSPNRHQASRSSQGPRRCREHARLTLSMPRIRFLTSSREMEAVSIEPRKVPAGAFNTSRGPWICVARSDERPRLACRELDVQAFGLAAPAYRCDIVVKLFTDKLHYRLSVVGGLVAFTLNLAHDGDLQPHLHGGVKYTTSVSGGRSSEALRNDEKAGQLPCCPPRRRPRIRARPTCLRSSRSAPPARSVSSATAPTGNARGPGEETTMEDPTPDEQDGWREQSVLLLDDVENAEQSRAKSPSVVVVNVMISRSESESSAALSARYSAASSDPSTAQPRILTASSRLISTSAVPRAKTTTLATGSESSVLPRFVCPPPACVAFLENKITAFAGLSCSRRADSNRGLFHYER